MSIEEIIPGVVIQTPDEKLVIKEPPVSSWERLVRKFEKPRVVTSKVYEEQDGGLSPDYGLENLYGGLHGSHWGEVDVREYYLFGVFYRRIETLKNTLRQTGPAMFDHNDLNGGIVLGNNGFKINF